MTFLSSWPNNLSIPLLALKTSKNKQIWNKKLLIINRFILLQRLHPFHYVSVHEQTLATSFFIISYSSKRHSQHLSYT